MNAYNEKKTLKRTAARPLSPVSAENLDRLGSELLELTGVCGWFSRNGHDILRWRGCPEDVFGIDISQETTLDNIIDIFSHADRARVRKAIIACLNQGKPWSLELARSIGKRNRVWLHASGKAVDINGVRHLVGIFRNVSHIKKIESELAQETREKAIANEMLSQLLDVVPNAIAAYDPEDRLIFFNKQYKIYYDKAAPAIRIGEKYDNILRFAVENGQYMNIDPNKAHSKEWMRTRLRRHKRGMKKDLVQQLSSGRWVQVRERKSSSGYTVFVSTDISELKKAEKRMRVQAEIDTLTGLLNRSSLLRNFGELLRNRREDADDFHCLILFDLDHFKSINDTLGHDIGDRLLETIGKRLRHSVRTSDIAARLGGDEFALILRGVGADNCEAIVEKLHSILTGPMKLEDRLLHPSVSMGVVIVSPTDSDAGDLIRKADAALFHAKADGRNTFRYFDQKLQYCRERRAYIIDGLRKAIETQAFEISLQPQILLADGSHAGFEALARWTHEGENISPAEFIPIAESNGMILDIGRIVMNKAFDWFTATKKSGLNPGRLAINVSAVQLKCQSFYDCLNSALQEYGINSNELEIEITETAIIGRDEELIERNLKRFANLGLHIALDDFGTGNATFSHLKRFPIDRLKIDRGFISDIGRNPESTIITQAIINLAHNLGMEVVAEGVETPPQKSFLRINGCDFAQGYLLSRPLTPQQAEEWLTRHAMEKNS